MIKSNVCKRIRMAFGWENVICRLIAAWVAFAAWTLISTGEGFGTLSYAMEEVSLGEMGLFILLFFAAYSLIAILLGALPSDSWFLLGGATACVYRWLLEYEHDTNEFLFLLAVTAAYSLFVFYFAQRNAALLTRLLRGKRTVFALAAVTAVISCTVIATIGCLRYLTFSSPNFDFGLFCNMFYNMKETGLPMVTSERDRLLSHFAVHISPIYYLLLPFYYLFPTPLTLQIGQAVALVAGVLPLLLLARHFKLSGKTALLMAAIYCFYPALSGGTFYDLHENCFLPFFLLFTFYFFEKKKYIPMYLSAVFVLAVKEDAAVYLFIFAVYVLLSERKYLHGGLLAAMSVGCFLLCGHLLETYGEGMMVNRFNNLIYNSEDGLLGAIKTALINPGFLLTQLFTTGKNSWEKIVYVLQLLLPLGFLPFCTKKPSRWLLTVPLLINLLTYYQYQYDIGFQYHFGITAFMFYAALKNLSEMQAPSRGALLSLAAAACCCFYVVLVIPKCSTYVDRWQTGKETYAQMEEILETVPEDASVAVSSFLLAHIADRDTVYEVKYHKNAPDVDYVVLDARYSSYKQPLAAYLDQGYTVYSEQEKLIVILVSPNVQAQ